MTPETTKQIDDKREEIYNKLHLHQLSNTHEIHRKPGGTTV